MLSAQAAQGEVERALAQWRQVADQAGAPRTRALAELARHDDVRVTQELLDFLSKATDVGLRVQVLDALGQKPRPQAIAALMALVKGKDTPPAVRQAAAGAAARQGNRAIDDLIALAAADPDRVSDVVRDACRRGLAQSGEERAYRGLAPLALRGRGVEQLAVLRLLVGAKDIKAVTQVRLRLLQDSDDLLRATAWRQLAAEGHPKAASALADVVERIGSAPDGQAQAEVLHGLAQGVPPAAYEDFLALAVHPSRPAQTALAANAAGYAKDAALVRWLVGSAFDRADLEERRVVLAIVSRADQAALEPVLPKLRAGMQKPTRDSVELALAALPALQQDPQWAADIQRLLDAADDRLRTIGLSLMLELDLGSAVELALAQVGQKSWELRSVAYRYLTRFRDLGSIPALIERYGKEDGRLQQELSDALFAHTGTRCWSREEWDAWWRKNRQGHALPAAETVAAASKKKPSGGGSTASYFGIPLVSKRCIFLIDTSGSMNAKIGTDKKRTRLDEVKKQLHDAVAKLPDDQWFNIYFYAGSPSPMWSDLRQAAGAEREEVLERIKKTGIGPGGTNIFDSVERAFGNVEVDTIYLLSDGEPSAGRITEPMLIAEQVRRWNYGRQVVVHCISVGTNSKMMERLARESGGEYVFVR